MHRTTAQEEDYENPTADGVLNWKSITSCALELDTVLENWQRILHEFSTRICTRIDCVVQWVGTEIREPPSFHGVNDLEEFLIRYEDEMLPNQRLLDLDIALKETPAIWWGAHKETVKDWYQCKRLLGISFSKEKKRRMMQRYDGKGSPLKHLENCITLWMITPPEEWTHYFLHALEGILVNWYVD